MSDKLSDTEAIRAAFVVELFDKAKPETTVAELRAQLTCLTNWMRNVATVVDGNDTDPHGLFRYVRSFPVADGTDAAMDAAVKDAEQRIIERWTSDADREADDKDEA